MMNEIETRIVKLAELIGISTENSSKELAELKGYAEGFKLIFGDFEKTALQLSPETADGTALALFCDMMGIDFSLTDQEKRELIKKGFLMEGVDYTSGEFEDKLTAAHFSAKQSAGTLTISAEEGQTAKDYEKLAEIIENYAAPNLFITFDGDGMTFEKWGMLDFMFDEYDRLKFPFSMLDTIKTEEI